MGNSGRYENLHNAPDFRTCGWLCRIWSGGLQKAWSTWGCRLCSQSSSSTQPSHHPRTQAEKAKRRQAREKAILSSDVNDPGLIWSDKEKIAYTAALVPVEKKDTTLPFPQSYSPEYVEFGWYQWWEKQGFFSPERHVWEQLQLNISCLYPKANKEINVDSKELSGWTLLSVPGYQHKVEFGILLTFAYPLEGQEGEVAVSTTRPETMLGDVAIAVHPDDPRYKDLHGKHCRHPFTERLLPIVTDIMVVSTFGTGAVKVTPAHDHTDFLLSQRHSLPSLTVIGGDGTMTSDCGQWLEGVKRFDARECVIIALMERKLFRGKKDHPMSLPFCSRSGDVIEPLLKKQWFVRCQEMGRKAVQAVEEGDLQIIPHFYTKMWKSWLSNISDWCISRQLWWGHKIPAYRVTVENSKDTEEEQWVWGRSAAEARQRAAVKFGVNPDAITLTQDPDVLDTWFSSGLFPFAMLGWPQQTENLKQFYPNSVLETGSDLIFFWVARMVILGRELTGQLPFKQVLFHSLVRDKYGRKMSKSLGNVIDPLDVISGVSLERLQGKVREGNLDPRESVVAMEAQKKDFPKGIPECGTDALRFALCSYKAQGEDTSLSVSHVLSCRHFCNKMWQTVRFTLATLHDASLPTSLAETYPLSSMDRWICWRLHSTVQQCERGFESYELHTVTSALHSFWLHGLCDVYLHIMYIVVEIFHHVTCNSCVVVVWAVCAPDQAETLLRFRSAVCTLGRTSALHLHCPEAGFTDSPPPPKASAVGVVDHSICLHLSVQNGINADKQRALLSQRREKLAFKLKQALARTQTPNYAEKVPNRVRQETENKTAAMEQELKNIGDQLLALEETRGKKSN
ncbi:valine--tRNA ligase, mitochondrial-like [Sinocyclocheilus grahami]|uniref:valine--tRNA ligase, mitochondrial-like n=1 Tax=Sinocyclocheilus grahami TaxID=75366 RepID=UPI0007ACFF9D|nr:PREDICTED: valine--tRNA ligase, mitochondrial-like [Sinocyclocheilus grahami]